MNKIIIPKQYEESLKRALKDRMAGALQAKEIILSGKFKDILQAYKAEIDEVNRQTQGIAFVTDLIHQINYVAMFADDNIKKKLQDLGIKEINLNYFISLEEITKEYRIIEDNNEFHIFLEAVITCLDLYLSAQTYIVVLDTFKIKNNDKNKPFTYANLAAAMINILRKQQYANKKEGEVRKTKMSNTLFEYEWENMKEKVEPLYFEIFGTDSMERTFASFDSRNIDKALVPIFKDFIMQNPLAEKKYSDRYKFLVFYNFFRLMMPHRNWAANQQEFIKIKEGGGKDFDEYRIAKMRKFIYKK